MFSYSQMSRPVGFEITFTLEGDNLVVDSLRKIDKIALKAVEEVRLSFESKSFVPRVFRLTLRLSDGKSVSLSSLTWRSMIEPRAQPESYRIFARALIEAVAHANPRARFVTGKSALVWGLTAGVTGALMLMVALFTWRSLQFQAWGTLLFGIAVFALGLWQLEPFVRLNRPGRFTPDAVPENLLP
jgi:hypothetical protein